ncbi:ABC transporter ATP-binding protein [Tranquillimonas rosea]|uniref:ABC transporter ATP-binding protein n=1 Tax=Tranquillimonas rosea TaxID=641238 RepID=UPI003BAB1AD0
MEGLILDGSTPTAAAADARAGATLRLRGLTKQFGDGNVVEALDLDVAAREFVVLVGPSGCGKSTTLRMVAGLEQPTAGDIEVDGIRVNGMGAAERDVAMVFQDYALYPHMTVAQNIGFGLRRRGTGRAETKRAVAEAAQMLELTELLDRRPGALSGGQRQRVAMGRAIVRRPRLFLFDEPLSNLDARLRVFMRTEVKRLHAMMPTTTLYVTHDQTEAMTMADRVVVMNGGRAEQIGPPMEIYDNPASRFVAGFMGAPEMNFATAELSADAVTLPGVTLPRPPVTGQGEVTLGLRAEALTAHAAPAPDRMPATLVLAEPLGADVHGLWRTDAMGEIWVRHDADARLRPGDTSHLAVDPARMHLFDPASGRTLRRRDTPTATDV